MKNTLPPISPGMKLAAQVSPEADEKELQFIRQMGVEYVVLWTNADKASYAYYADRKQYFADHGLTVYGFGNSSVHNQDAIVLNLPGRDEKIEEYLSHLHNLGKAGIPYTTYAHMANGIWSTEREFTRGEASSRAFDLSKAEHGWWVGKEYTAPLTHGRKYTEAEIWENFIYFIKQVVPVAEEAGVRIGIHPDDPPVSELGGVQRCIFSSFEGYRRALEISDSPNVGICLCVGCWLEGGTQMGKDVLETIQYFGERQKLFKIHFRNVDQSLPHFVETFIDDGYMDMYLVMKKLQEVSFDGILIPDHIPMMGDDRRLGTAFTLGYIKSLVDRVKAEGL